jgi:hypothetical protein
MGVFLLAFTYANAKAGLLEGEGSKHVPFYKGNIIF